MGLDTGEMAMSQAARLPVREDHSVDVERDIDAIFDAFKLQEVRRYYGQMHWTAETQAAAIADEAEAGLKLENAAAHSWHVADAALLLSGHFRELNQARVVVLALLHDKLEIFTGDFDPVGPDGRGEQSHAFNAARRAEKENLEWRALHQYLASLRDGARAEQQALFDELLTGHSPEARFVKAVDKMQALAFVVVKKDGALTDEHLDFTLRYSAKAIEYFPDLTHHYALLVRRLVRKIAAKRKVPAELLLRQVPTVAV